MNSDDVLLTKNEVAKILGYRSYQSINRLFNEGLLTPVKRGSKQQSRVFVWKSDVIRLAKRWQVNSMQKVLNL